MTFEVIDCEQNSTEWHQARCGLPTASVFDDVMAKVGPRGGLPKGRQKLLWRLAAETITGFPEETYQNATMLRGHANEQEACDLYALMHDIEPQALGFIRNGNCGASPDRALGDDGLLEIKDAIGSIQVERLIDGTLPSEYRAQCQGQLMVSERRYVDFMSHSRGLPPLVVRVERDEKYIAELRAGVDQFCAERDALVTWLKAMR